MVDMGARNATQTDPHWLARYKFFCWGYDHGTMVSSWEEYMCRLRGEDLCEESDDDGDTEEPVRSKRVYRRSTHEDEEFVRKNYGEMLDSEMATALGISAAKIFQIRRRLGLKRVKGIRRCYKR